MPTLFYVDDTSLVVPTLREALKPLREVWHLEAIAGSRAPERLMAAVDESGYAPEDRFLLDIFMPAPRALRVSDVWPPGTSERDQYCGLALARWLEKTHNTQYGRIGLISHVDAEKEHKQALLGFFVNQAPRYFRKAELGKVLQWLC
jgi:hypothetical protein